MPNDIFDTLDGGTAVAEAPKDIFDQVAPKRDVFDVVSDQPSKPDSSDQDITNLIAGDMQHKGMAPLGKKGIEYSKMDAVKDFAFHTQKVIPKMTPEEAGKWARLTDVSGVYGLLPENMSNRVAGVVENVVADTGNFFTSPAGIATLGLGLLPKLAQTAVTAAFTAEAIKHAPELGMDFANAKTPKERDAAATAFIENAAVGAPGAHHILSRARIAGKLLQDSGFTPEEADRAATQNQQLAIARGTTPEGDLLPETLPTPKDVQPVTPEALDALHLSREKLTQGFNGQTPEVKAQRQASIDDIDNQLLRADKDAVDASALRVAQRDTAPPAPEVPPESAPSSPPADTVTEPVTEQPPSASAVVPQESLPVNGGDTPAASPATAKQISSDAKKWTSENYRKRPENRQPIPATSELPTGSVVRSKVYGHEGDIITTGPAQVNSNGVIEYPARFTGTGRSAAVEADHITEIVSRPNEQTIPTEQKSTAPVMETPDQSGARLPVVEGVPTPQIDETVSKTYADSAERIADQVTKGQPTTVREAARDAALDNAMGSLRAGKTPSVSFMRKSAQTAAGAHADRLGESLDAPVGEGETTKLDQEAAPAPKPENTELLSAMDKAIGGLSERESKIVRGVQEGRTLDDIATEHGLSKQRISQIVQESLPKLRSALEDAGFTKDDYAGGPGAMGPLEALEMKAREVDTTGLKCAVVDTERLARGAEPIPTVERQREEGVVRAAEDKAAEDPTAAPSLISRIVDAGDKAISEHDAALLLVERARLMNERKAWEERLGRGEDVNIAKTRLSEIENETERLDRAQRSAGTTWGRLGHMYQRMIRDDYTLDAMERKMRASVERPLTKPEKSKLKEQSEEIQRLQKELEEKQTTEVQTREDEGVRATIEATINELGKSYLKKPAYGKEVFDAARKIVDNWKSEADKARERLKNTAYFSSIGPSTAEIRDLAIIVRAYVGEFGLTKAEAGARLVSEFGPKVKPHIDKIWSATKAAIAGEKTTEKVKNVTKEGLKKEGEPTTTEAAASAKADSVAGDALDKNTVGKVVRALINEGVHGEVPLMEGAHKILKEAYPDITERDVRRTFSDYGKAKFPSKDAVKVEERELRNLVRLQESIDRIQKDALDPLKTGLQRDKATQLVREKQKQLNELLKKRGGAPSPEKLAAGQEARRTALKNRIEDIDKELKTGVKQPKSATVPDDVQTEQLRAERDAMQAKLDEVERESNPPEPEHVQELKRLQDRIDETRDRLARLDLEKPPGKATVDTPEIAASKAELKQLNDTITELRKPKPKSAADKQVEQLAKTRDKITETLSGKRPPNAPKDWNPLSSEAENIKAEIQALNELAAQMKRDAKPPNDPNAAKERQQIRALEDAIRNYEDKLAKGDFSTGGKMHGPDTAKVSALKAIRDARKGAYDAAKKAGKPVMTPEERYNATRMKQVEKRISELQEKISKGDFTRPPKRETPKKNPAVLDAEFRLSKEKQKFNNGVFEAQLKQRSNTRKVLEGIRDTLNTARSIRTAFDLSAVLRQGGFFTFGHPIRAAKAFPAMFKALASEKGQFEVNQEIQNRPNAPLYKSSKLHLSDPGDPHLTKMEENYMSRWSSKIPGVSHSERAYTTFLNRIRADSFDAMMDSIGKDATPKEAEAIANFVNVATGRGNLAGAAGAAISLNTAFFAPRYVISRFEMLAGQPFYKGSSRTRIAIAKEYAKYLAALGVIYTLAQSSGAKVEYDPRSADFGKLKFGNTRVDLLSGLSQSAVVLSRIATQKTKSQGSVKPADSASVAGRFVRSKLAPAPGAILDVTSGKNVVGEKITPKDAALGLVLPMGFNDIHDALRDNGVPEAAALSLLSIFGASIQSYKDSQNGSRK